MLLGSIWRVRRRRNSDDYRTLRSLGSAIISTAREKVVKVIDDGNTKTGGDRVRRHLIDIISALFTSVGLVVGIIVIWVELIFMGVLFLLLVLDVLS